MDEYAAGRTPNPCLRCNEKIKFAAVLDRALGLGLRRGRDRPLRAAAHRCRRPGRDAPRGRPRQGPVLRARGARPGAAAALAVPARRLDQGRRSARRRPPAGCGSPTSRTATTSASSPNGDNAGWLREKLGDRAPNHGGAILDESGAELGRHDGTYAFTIGQRKGLRLGAPAPDGKPRFVLDIEPVSGTVTVGPREHLAVHRLTGIRPRWCGTVPSRLEGPMSPCSCARTATSTARWSRSTATTSRSSCSSRRTASPPARPRWSTTAPGWSARRRSRAPAPGSLVRDVVASGWGPGRHDVVGAGRRRAGAGGQPDEGAGRDGGEAARPRREVPVHADFDSVVAGERFELDEAGDQDPDTWADVGGTRRCASCAGGRSCSPATSPPTWSWSRPGWPRSRR